jgi:hypothetical protein
MLSPNSLFQRLGTKPKLEPQPFSGWPLELACRIDMASPSFVAHTFLASNLKRQSIFAALAELDTSKPDDLAARLRAIAPADCTATLDPLAQIGRALMVAEAREIVGAVFGWVPDGMIGILARISGSEPFLKKEGYRDLFRLLDHSEYRERAKVLLQIAGKISALKIEIVLRLDPVLVHLNVVSKLHSLDDLHDLHAALDLVRATCSTASNENLRRSVEQLAPSTDLREWLTRWLAKSDRLLASPPVPTDDPDLKVLLPRDLPSASRAWRNCLQERLVHSAIAQTLYLEWRHPPGALIELRRLTTGWLLVSIHGVANTAVDPPVQAEVRRKLAAFGVAILGAPLGCKLPCRLSSLLNVWDLEDGLGALDDKVPEPKRVEAEHA